MSSRQEEKERRRQERLEREQAEAKRASRRKRMQLAFGGLLALAAIAGIVVAVLVSTGGDGGGGDGPQRANSETAAELPVQATSDIKEAAKAADCTLNNPPYEGNAHDPDKQFKASDYKTNPPTSGPHSPTWYEDGIYAPGDVPELGKLVHPLEHGRILVQYKPGTPEAVVDQLEALLAENEEGYHMMLFENTTGMEAQVAATAWTHSVTCPKMNDKVFDAIRTFRARYIDKGPERVA